MKNSLFQHGASFAGERCKHCGHFVAKASRDTGKSSQAGEPAEFGSGICPCSMHKKTTTQSLKRQQQPRTRTLALDRRLTDSHFGALDNPVQERTRACTYARMHTRTHARARLRACVRVSHVCTVCVDYFCIETWSARFTFYFAATAEMEQNPPL